MKKAKVITIIEGHEVMQINAWSVNDGADNRKIKGYFKTGDVVDIMEAKGDYVEIRGIGYKYDKKLAKEVDNQKVRGWVHRAFLIDEDNTDQTV